MKRFLSIILAVALVIAMVPATFAAGEVKTELKYVFNYDVFGLIYSGSNNEYPYTTSKGIAPDAFKDKFDPEKSDLWSYVGAANHHTVSIQKGGSLYVTHKKGDAYKKLGANATVFKISVEDPGSYKVAINTYKAPLAAKTNVYLVDSDYADANGFVFTSAAGINKVIADENTMYVGYMDTYDAKGSPWVAANNTTVDMDTVDLEKKDYYVVFSIDGSNSKIYAAEQSGAATPAANYYYYIRSIALTRQPSISLSIDAPEIAVESNAKLIAVAKNADATAADAEISYSASPADVVSVASDGTVTGLKIGEATITAKATIGGVECSDSVEVKVKSKDKDYEYVFSRQAVGVTGDTNPGWSGYKTYSSIVTSVSPNRYCYVGGVELAAGALRNGNSNYAVRLRNIKPETNALVLKLEIPYGGAYKPSFVFNPYRSGAQVTFYLLKSSDAESKNWNMSNAGNITAAMEDAKNEGSPVIEVGTSETYSALHTKVNANVTAADEFKDVKLDSGDYYLIMSLTGVHDDVVNLAADDPEKIYNEIWPKSFKLTAQPYVTVSADTTEIIVGGSTKVVGKAFKADDTAAGAVTYSASPADVATVAADGTVTALKAGMATITAKATIGGIEYSDSVKITVKKNVKTQKFVFGNKVIADEIIAEATDKGVFSSDGILKNTAINGGIEYLYGFDAIDESKGTSDWAISSYGGGVISHVSTDSIKFFVGKTLYGNDKVSLEWTSATNIDTRVVLELDIKESGTYDVMASMVKGDKTGTEADAYLVSAEEMESKKNLMGVTVAEIDDRFAWYDEGVYKVTPAFIKTLDRLGHINGVNLAANETEQYVGTATLTKGVYYLILNLASDNILTSNKTQHTFQIAGLTFTESESAVDTDEASDVTGTFSFATSLDNAIKAVACGEEVEISAPETDGNGNVFKCWTKNGVYVSSKATDTYKVMTNTYLKAVYAPAGTAEDKVVSFYKENGEYFMTIPAVDGKVVLPEENPALPGLVFDAWYTADGTELEAGAELTKAETIAVAKFNGRFTTTELAEENQNLSTDSNIQAASAKADIVNVNGAGKHARFNTEIVCEDNGGNVTHWLRDGRVASYDAKYSYFIWDGTNIYSSYAPIVKKPLILIENRAINGAVMIEYDRGNQNIAEVGILFGSSAGIDIKHCNSKAASQRNNAHGQFSATPVSGDAYARGYLIYGSEGNYKVIYTDAFKIN